MLTGRGKFGAKILSHYTDIEIFVLGYFIPTHPVIICETFYRNIIIIITNAVKLILSFGVITMQRVQLLLDRSLKIHPFSHKSS